MSNIEKQYVDPSGLSSYDSEIKNWVDDKISTSLTDFEGATSSSGGAAGQVPAPSAGDDEKFLRGDGTWAAVAGGVTGVKGNAETNYRTGNVNLTPANLGLENTRPTYIGTKSDWEKLSAAEKAIYEIVMTTDEDMTVTGNRIFVGTTAEWTYTTNKSEYRLVVLTDD